jgi:hypothetical protein
MSTDSARGSMWINDVKLRRCCPPRVLPANGEEIDLDTTQMADKRIVGDRWRVVERLGHGGQGVVYKVEDITADTAIEPFENRLMGGILGVTGHGHDAFSERQYACGLVDVIVDIARSSDMPKTYRFPACRRSGSNG